MDVCFRAGTLREAFFRARPFGGRPPLLIATGVAWAVPALIRCSGFDGVRRCGAQHAFVCMWEEQPWFVGKKHRRPFVLPTTFR